MKSSELIKKTLLLAIKKTFQMFLKIFLNYQILAFPMKKIKKILNQ